MGGKASDPNKAAMKAQREQMRRLDRLSVPELEEYILQSPELVGLLNAEEISKSALEDITTDPRLKAIQQGELERLGKESEEGMSAADRLQMEEMLGAVGAQEKSQRAAINQEMARQGMGDSGAALQAKLLGSQGGANAARRQAMQMLAQSGDRRRQAAAQRATMAGQKEGQDFARQAQVGSATDAINRANAMNRQQVAQANLAARQNIANQRANIANIQAGMANQLAQQNFQNQLSRGTGQGSVANAMSNIAANTPAKPSGFQAALGGAATGAALGSAVPGIGTGVGAAVGAGAGLLGMMEDGGVAYENGGVVGGVPVDVKALEAHQKQEANFKRKYMKKIHNELLGNDSPNGQVVRAEDGIVVVNGQRGRYVEDPEAPEGRIFVPLQDNTSKGVVESGKVKLKKGETLQDVRDAKIDGDKLTKGLGALKDLLGAKSQEREKLELGSFQMDAPKNVMTAPQAMDFGNPFAQAAEDGAVVDPVADIIGKAMARKQMAEGGSEEAKMMDMIRSMEEVPAMQDGGTYQAQDGSLLFTSDGSGDIVEGDSYERDRVDARLNSGEMVLNAAQQQRLMDMLRGEISLDELGDEDIVEGVPREYQEDIINGDDDGDIQAKGMNRLLDMLGRK